jgi:hypothetical protein
MAEQYHHVWRKTVISVFIFELHSLSNFHTGITSQMLIFLPQLYLLLYANSPVSVMCHSSLKLLWFTSTKTFINLWKKQLQTKKRWLHNVITEHTLHWKDYWAKFRGFSGSFGGQKIESFQLLVLRGALVR